MINNKKARYRGWMMAKDILYGYKAMESMLAGVNVLADAVQVTMGPQGHTVVIQHRTSGITPIITKDGVTVANSISLKDQFKNVGVTMLQHMVGEVSKESGDGTTTSVVLARRFLQEVVKGLSVGMDPNDILRGIELATLEVTSDLAKRARDCSDRISIAHVATVASNGEKDIGELLAKAVELAGDKGMINIELGYEMEDKIELVEGMRWEQGYLSPFFVTDSDRNINELTFPYILLYDRVIHRFDELIPLLDLVTERGGTLLIIADDIDEAALPGLLLNHIRGVIRCVAVKPPGYGDHRSDTLEDLAVMTGGRVLVESNDDSLADIKIEDLGRVASVMVTEDEVTILGATGNKLAIQERLAGLKIEYAELESGRVGTKSPTGRNHALEGLSDRIKGMAGNNVIIKVGGLTDLIIKERLQRIENAHNSVKAALKEGVLAGGGVGLLRSGSALDDLKGANKDQDYGIAIVRKALEEPVSRISANSGLDPSKVISTILSSDQEFWGLNAMTGIYGDLYESGILDPVMVTRLALEKAASIACSMVTTGCVVIELPPDDPTFGYTAEWAAATREDPRS
jgi:chaperonin GroEL